MMENQEANIRISNLSRMNAFYGIPNLSQETALAIQQGMPAPEVYSSEARQEELAAQGLSQQQESSASSPLEDYFNQATETIQISGQGESPQSSGSAQASSQGANNAQVPSVSANEGLYQARTAYDTIQSGTTNRIQNSDRNLGSAAATTTANQPQAATALNSEATTSGYNTSGTSNSASTAPEDINQPTYDRFTAMNTITGSMAGQGGAQLGTFFSALG